MENPIINIIVPIYNVEKYLSKCLDSIIAQTYLNTHIILVDDGSTDNSSVLCDQYKERDNRVTVIHRTNGGLSAARNSGIDYVYKHSSDIDEEYIVFIDGDDYIASDYLEFLYNLLIDNNADISQCGYYLVYSDLRKVQKSRDTRTVILGKESALESLCYNLSYDVSFCNKLFKCSLFKEIRFPVGTTYEDTATSYKIVEKASKIALNLTAKYYYVQRYNSIANGNVFNEAKYDFITVGDMMADYVSEIYPNLKNAANAKRVYVRLSTLSQLVNTNHYDKQKIHELRFVIKQYRKDILKDSNVSRREKIGVVAISIGYAFYYFVWKLYYTIVRRR